MSDNKREKKSTISVSFRMDTALRKAVGEYLAKINQGIYLGTEKLTMKEIVEESLRAEMEGRIQKSTKGTSSEGSTKDFGGNSQNPLANEDVRTITIGALQETLAKLLDESGEIKRTLVDISNSLHRPSHVLAPTGHKKTEGRKSAQNPSRNSAADQASARFEQRLKNAVKDASSAGDRVRKPVADKRQPA